MLTNKTSRFAKSLALIMALLMVLSVCLTGCGNKAADEANKKADDALAAADEAKTAADAVAAALADYLKVTDAVAMEEIKAEITKALEGYASSEDLAAFATSEQLTALSDKLADYALKSALDGYVADAELTAVADRLKAAEASVETILADYVTGAKLTAATKDIADMKTKVDGLDAKIKDELVGYALTTEVDALEGKLSKLTEVVSSILQAFGYTKDEADALLKPDAATPVLVDIESPAETLTAQIMNKIEAALDEKVADAMSKEEWDTTTTKVLATIKTLQTLIEKLYATTTKTVQADTDQDGDSDVDEDDTIDVEIWKVNYSTAARNEINGFMFGAFGINIFVEEEHTNLADDTKKVKKLTGVSDKEETLKMMEYALLRAATEDDLGKLMAAIDNANAVKSFEDDLAATLATLLTVGDVHTNAQYKDGNTRKEATVQVMTIDYKANFLAFNASMDDLFADYVDDDIFDYDAKTTFDDTYGSLTALTVWKGTEKEAGKGPDGATFYYASAQTSDSSKLEYANKDKYNWTVYTYGTSNRTVLNTAAGEWLPMDDTKTYKGWGVYMLPEVMFDTTFGAPAGASAATGVYAELADATAYYLPGYHGFTHGLKADGTLEDANKSKPIPNVVANSADKDLVYLALYVQLTECQQLIEDANAAFKAWLDLYFITANPAQGQPAKWSEDSSKTVDDFKNALTIPMCDYFAEYYAPNTNVTVPAYFLIGEGNNGAATVVKKLMEAALNRNTCVNGADHSDILKDAKDGIDKYELYNALIDKSWDVLFDKYKSEATLLLNKIRNDYVSVVDYIEATTSLAGNAGNDIELTGAADFISGKLNAAEHSESGAFLYAFINGDYEKLTNGATEFAWASSNGAIKVTEKYAFPLELYYKNASAAATPNWNVESTVVSGVPVDKIVLGEADPSNADADYINRATDVTADPLKTLGDTTTAYYVRLYLPASILSISNQLNPEAAGGMKVADAKANYDDPHEAFTAILDQAVDNMNEVYNRFLLVDYKKAMINEVYADALTQSEFFGAYDTTTVNDYELVAAMENYLTGYSKTAAAQTVLKGTDYEAKYTAEGATSANVLFDKVTKLKDASLITALAADELTVDPYGYIGEYVNIELTATGLLTDVNEIVESYKADLVNFAIKRHFVKFLNDTQNRVDLVAYAYQMATGYTNATMISEMDLSYRSVTAGITVTRLQELNGEIVFDEYKELYTGLLSITFTENENKHANVLLTSANGTVKADDPDTTDKNEAVNMDALFRMDLPSFKYDLNGSETNVTGSLNLGNLPTGIPSDNNGWEWVVGLKLPYDISKGAAGDETVASTWTYVGSFVQDLDEILNADATFKFKKKDATTFEANTKIQFD